MTNRNHATCYLHLAILVSEGRGHVPQAEPVCCFAIGRVSTIKLRQDDCTVTSLELFHCIVPLGTPTCIDREVHNVDTEYGERDSARFGLQ